MLLISVIVPVYNTEQYLPDCLHSILNQTYQNIEIILVNDGSTDNSLQICMDYAETDPRITVIQNPHQGLVATRKSGVEYAHGDYCMFVDSDDWIAKNLLESLLPLTENGHIDMICYNMESVENQKHIPWHHTIPEGKYEQQQLETVWGKMMFDFEEGSPGILQSLYTKLIKTPLLLESLKSLDPRISMGEDAAVTYIALLHAKRIVITNKSFYFYRIRQGSMCNSKNIDVFSKIYFFQECMQTAFSNCKEQYQLQEQLQAYLLLLLRIGINNFFSLKMRALYHIPFDLPELGRKIVLYGAGSVGKSYYRQLLQSKNVELIAWVDQKLSNKYVCHHLIESPDRLKNMHFDTLLIAVNDKEIASEITTYLNTFISDKRILWAPHKVYWWEKEFDL